MDHLPPPPAYTETDTSSNFDLPTPSTTTASTNLSPGQSQYTPSVTSTSDSTPIVYTPPYSPSDSIHSNEATADYLSHTSNPRSAHSISPTISVSAAAYFESRPFMGSVSPSPIISHSITLSPSGRVRVEQMDFPEPASEWLRREVTSLDWDTFVNFLVPYHDLKDNVLGRGGRGLDEMMGQVDLGQNGYLAGGGGNRGDVRRRDNNFASVGDEKMHTDKVIREWNRGFFEPRGLLILIKSARVPSNGDNVRTRASRPTNQPEESRPTDRTSGFSRFIPRFNENGFRLGNMVADHTGFRIGNALIADQNGFRMGGRRGIVADSRGGFSIFGRGFDGSRGPSESLDVNDHRESFRDHHGRHRRHDSHHHDHSRRGRRYGSAHNRRNRSESTSSSSSSSSSNSSDSDSDSDSNCSLISVSKVKDPQLPIIKQSLHDWLNHPDHPPITPTTIHEINHSIRDSPPNNEMIPSRAEIRALRQEVQGLMRAFKDLQRVQKMQGRLQKRERRAIRRAEKRGRRAEKRERKRERREVRREGRYEGRRIGRNVHSTPPQRLPTMAQPIRGSLPPEPGFSGVLQGQTNQPRNVNDANSASPPQPTLEEQETGIAHVDGDISGNRQAHAELEGNNGKEVVGEEMREDKVLLDERSVGLRSWSGSGEGSVMGLGRGVSGFGRGVSSLGGGNGRETVPVEETRISGEESKQ